jgi:hypothetical protein
MEESRSRSRSRSRSSSRSRSKGMQWKGFDGRAAREIN